jgi:hypothetical protein
MARRPPRAKASGGSNGGPRVAAGIATGIGVWVVGYLVAFVLALIESAGSFGTVDLGAAATWKVVGWVLHGAHFVGVSAGGRSVNVVTETGGIYLVMLGVVPLLLLLVGVMLGADGYGPLGGASVAAGYFPMAVVGAFLFEIPFFTVSVGPNLLTSALFMGIAYPVVFGGLGGLLAPS